MNNTEILAIFKRLKSIASYFSKKTPKGITFRDADNYDYEIYGLFQEWQKSFPSRDFKKEFPCFDALWEELASWDAQESWTHERAERIIKSAKNALKEIDDYLRLHE